MTGSGNSDKVAFLVLVASGFRTVKSSSSFGKKLGKFKAHHC
jgi:hypothetical protein